MAADPNAGSVDESRRRIAIEGHANAVVAGADPVVVRRSARVEVLAMQELKGPFELDLGGSSGDGRWDHDEEHERGDDGESEPTGHVQGPRGRCRRHAGDRVEVLPGARPGPSPTTVCTPGWRSPGPCAARHRPFGHATARGLPSAG